MIEELTMRKLTTCANLFITSLNKFEIIRFIASKCIYQFFFDVTVCLDAGTLLTCVFLVQLYFKCESAGKCCRKFVSSGDKCCENVCTKGQKIDTAAIM